MNIDELADEYRLNLAVPDIVERVERVSGKRIDFRPTPKLDVRARTKMARERMSRHVILFNPKEWPHLSHIIAHECARILRIFEIPPEDRRVPASTSETLRVARSEIYEEAEYLPADLRDEVVDMWIHGLVTQVTSQPIDVRIEEWIRDNYPGLKDEQKRSLRTETRTITASISPDVKHTTPASVFRRSYALNYAYLDHMGDVMGRSFEGKFRGDREVIALGEEVSRVLDNDEISDQELVNRLAEVITMHDWFVWVDFEDMPTSYYLNQRPGR